jgi:hypothetical protein
VGFFFGEPAMTDNMNEMPVDTETLQILLSSEMTAVEVYTQALGTFDDEFVIADLQKIRDEHRRSVRELRDHIVGLGLRLDEHGIAPHKSEPTMRDPANVVGPAVALAVLRQGEEQGITGYEAALENVGLDPDCRRRIRSALLPACRKHVEQLNLLLGGMGH